MVGCDSPYPVFFTFSLPRKASRICLFCMIRFGNMKIRILIVTAMLLLCLLAYYYFFPKNTFLTFYLDDKSGIAFSRSSISYKHPPDSFSSDGINHIAPYVSKLFAPSPKYKVLHIFTADGYRGLSLDARDGQIKIGFVAGAICFAESGIRPVRRLRSQWIHA